MKILIVDDDINSTVTMKALLMSQDGFEIDIAHNGPSALEMMAEKKYDLIFLDIMMPNFSGLDVCRSMGGDEKIKDVPIILSSALPISSLELKDMLEEFKNSCRVTGVLEKPFSLEKMLEEINKVS